MRTDRCWDRNQWDLNLLLMRTNADRIYVERKSNDAMANGGFTRHQRSVTFESTKDLTSRMNSMNKGQTYGARNRSKIDPAIRRTLSDGVSHFTQGKDVVNFVAPRQELRQRLHSQDKDEERTPLIDSVKHPEKIPKGYSGATNLALSLHATDVPQCTRQRNLSPRSAYKGKVRINDKHLAEETIYMEDDEEDGAEANDVCEPLPQKTKKGRVWTRFSQKSETQRATNLERVKSAPGNIFYGTNAKPEPKTSVVSLYSPTPTSTSSSRYLSSQAAGRLAARAVTSTVEETSHICGNTQRVHATRCELYTNRAILLSILTGFVLFFVGSISFVAYVLSESSYDNGYNSSEDTGSGR